MSGVEHRTFARHHVRLGWLLPALVMALLLLPVAGARADTIEVTNTANSGPGSLRGAIAIANAVPTSDVVDATDVSGTIQLTSALPALSDDVEIRGSGASQLTVHRLGAFPAFRIFTVNAGVDAKVSGLAISNGVAEGGFPDGSGGGVWNGGTLTVENSIVSGNEADGIAGGIYNLDTGTLTLRSSTVSENRAADDHGGGILNSGTMTVESSTVSANQATDNMGTGGGISNVDGMLTLRNSIVTENEAESTAGGIRNTAAMTVANSTVSGNTADADAGILNGAVATLTLRNSTVSGNEADSTGGGIRNSGTVTATNSTVSGNSANVGANVQNFDTASLKGTILSDPQGGGANCDDPDSALTSQGYNLADDGSCALTETTDQPSTNPMLGLLRDNGGPTETMALPPGSPAIDKGIGGTLTTDQRGRSRRSDFPSIPNASGGDGADVGAFELQAPPVQPPPVQPPAGRHPSNVFSFGKVTGNKKRGTARLTVNVPGPGDVELMKTKKLKGKGTRAEAEGRVKLLLKSKGKAKQKLKKSGKAKVAANVTYTPDGGTPSTQTKPLKLVKR